MIFPKYRSQRVYFPAGTPGTLLVAANTLYALPFQVNGNMPFQPDQIGFNVTTGAAGANDNVRVGIYSDVNGNPDTLLFDSGVILVSTTTGAKTASIASNLRPLLYNGTVYWLAMLCDTLGTTQPTVAAKAAGTGSTVPDNFFGVANMGAIPSAAASTINGITASQAFGALPTTFPTVTYAANGAMPLVGLRHA